MVVSAMGAHEIADKRGHALRAPANSTVLYEMI